MIAFAEVMLQRGLNPAEQLLVIATDIDPLATDMTFIQLSLLGIPAIVNTGNSLALTVNRTRCTPVWYINNWGGAGLSCMNVYRPCALFSAECSQRVRPADSLL